MVSRCFRIFQYFYQITIPGTSLFLRQKRALRFPTNGVGGGVFRMSSFFILFLYTTLFVQDGNLGNATSLADPVEESLEMSSSHPSYFKQCCETDGLMVPVPFPAPYHKKHSFSKKKLEKILPFYLVSFFTRTKLMKVI
jgi:hypothetical protein